MNKNKFIGESYLKGTPQKPFKFKLGPEVVKTDNIADATITPEKLSENVKDSWLNPVLDAMFNERIRPLIENLEKSGTTIDEKYESITQELYSMIASLQTGGIALSQKFGYREDIGISQKTLTKAIGRLWEELGTITGKTYIDYTLTVQPTQIWAEGIGTVTVIADCSDAISDFDNIKAYVNGVLKAESHDVSVYTQTLTIEEDGVSTIKVVGVIFGKTIAKEVQVTKAVPFFMGGGQSYQEVMVPECAKGLDGSLEGEYDATISTTGQYLFVVIPISKKEEFRRCKMDMNGFEIPIETTEMTDYIVCKSLNQYQAGTYNIDIDINS